MVEKSKTVHVVEIHGQANNLHSTLQSLKKDFQGIAMPADLQKIFTRLEESIGTIQRKTKDGVISREEFQATVKELGKVDIAFDSLASQMETLRSANDKKLLSLLPEDTVNKLKQADAAYEKYAKTVETVVRAEKSLEEARAKLAAAKSAADSAGASERAYKGKVTIAQKELATYSNITAALKEQTEATQELADAQKELEKAKKQGKGEAAIAKRQGRVDEAQRRKSAADSVISGFSKKDMGAYEAALKKVADAEEKHSISKKNSEQASKALSTAEVAVTAAKDDLARAQNKSDQDAQAEAAALQALRNALESISPEYKNMSIEGKNTTEQLEFLRKKVSGLSDVELKKLKASLGKADNGFQNFKAEAKETANALDRTKDAIKQQDEVLSEQNAIKGRIKQFLGLQGVTRTLSSILRDAMRTIKELDETMTEMAVVTDLSVGDYWDQLPEYSARASELGVSINDAYKAATLYYQQGLKSNEVTKLSTQTLKMARISGLSAEDATNKMTAALRGFNMELNEASAQNIADVYSELAAITAASTKEIANAMTKTASIAHSAGMEFETTSAFLSQIIETTRESAETAGTAMKTIIARFQELKKAPGEIGEVDGEIIDANQIETALRSVGVALRNSSGQFRDLDDVFLELSSKWDGLDKNTQRYIATIAAGSRQQSRFIAMMSDYGRTQELVSAANNSAGASNVQFEKTLESLDAKLEKLKNAWHEFTMGIMDSSLVKTGIDILTKFVEVINKATSAFDGLGGSLVKISSVLAIFKVGRALFAKFQGPLISFFAKIVSESRKTGEQAAQAMDEGARSYRGRQSTQSGAKQQVKSGGKTTVKKAFIQAGGVVANKTGLSNIFGKSVTKEAREALEPVKTKKLQAEENFKSVASTHSEDSAEFLQAQDELNQATKEYKDVLGEAGTEQQYMMNAGYEQSKKLGQGLSQAGSAAMGLGVAMSMIGGLLSSLGLEEVGETVSKIGNGIMIAGAALSALGPIITGVASIAQAAGISTQAAWGWVGLILAGVALLITAAVFIFKEIDKNNPEKKLKRAQEAADGAAKGAEAAAESYKNLADSINSLDEKQDVLKDMRKGTEEWNQAVQDVNSSVLDLIDKYPELAGFVENEGGVLKLDVDSQEVQDVMNAYKEDEVMAKGASIGAKAALSRADAEYELNAMDDKIFEKFQTEGQGAATLTAFGNLAAATGVGAVSGLAIGAGIGAFAGGVGAGPGAVVGAIAGGLAGLGAGIASFQYTVDQVEKNNEQNRQNVKELAQAYANGETGTTIEEIADYIERNGIAAGDAAKEMANSLLIEAETMKSFGDTLNAVDEQQKAYYQAMATNAQQLINLGAYSEQALNQMSTVVDEDLVKQFEETEKERLKNLSKNDAQAFQKEKEALAKSYGQNARVEGNKIVDEKGETIREFVDSEAWTNEIAAANATLKAAEAMEQIPGAILNSIRGLQPELQRLFSKAFEGEDLTASELKDFSEQLGTVTYTTTDEDGNIVKAKSWDELDQGTKDIWGSEAAYLKSLDADYSGIDTMWGQLTDAQKKAYGWNGDTKDEESIEKAKEAYEATFTEIVNAQTKAFENANASAEKLGITLSDRLSSTAAQAWTSGLESVASGASAGEIQVVNDNLSNLLAGVSEDQVDLVMSEINAMDKMDIGAWDQLAERFDELNIEYNANALKQFADSGKLAYNAIQKINFDTLAQDINNIYKVMEKTKFGARTYSESDYKEIIAANKSLEDAFTQVGDEFIYVGGNIQELTNALEEGTIDKLGEANRQLKSRSDMSAIIDEESEKYGSVDAMDNLDLMSYLTQMRDEFAKKNLNIADFGIAGLSNETDFSRATTEQLKEWAKNIALEGGKSAVYSEDYAEGVKRANILRYSHNTASYNAEMALRGGEFAGQHQEALILQAIQSGGVSNDTIEAYRKAIESGNQDAISSIGAQIAEQTEKIVESNEGRNAYKDLVDRVEAAIEKSRQEQIDGLSNIYEGINSASQKLVDKMQEQIDQIRQQEQLEEDKQNITDLYSQLAYLGMDTSGGSALQAMEVEQNLVDAEKQLEQTLVDQALQNLQDANDKAAEQRETQIAILQSQLDYDKEYGRLAEEANMIVSEGMSSLREGQSLQSTEMYQKLFEGEGKNLGELAAEDWASSLQQAAVQAQNWFALQGVVKDNATGNEEATDPNSSTRPDSVNSQLIANATRAAKDALTSATGGGYHVQSQDQNSAFSRAYQVYKDAGGTKSMEDFAKEAAGDDYRKYDSYVAGEITTKGNNFNWKDAGKNKEEDGPIKLSDGTEYRVRIKGSNSAAAAAAQALNINNNEAFVYSGGGYIYHDGVAYKIIKSKKGGEWHDFTGFKTGGLANFTGPAWLDGTKSRPEYVLNADQTERFFSLVDVLEGYDKDKKPEKSGDNYFEIEINVEKLENDYDVERVADKIRKMIYEDAMYRNVNAINSMR